MKKIKAVIILAVLSVISALNANAQSGGPDWGGLWCIVDVDLKHDHTERGYAYYLLHNPLPDGAIITATEGLEAHCCMGPGSPVLVGKDGETYLKLRLSELLLDNEEYATLYVDVNTDVMVQVMSWNHPIYGMWATVPKYYTIQLNVKNTDW